MRLKEIKPGMVIHCKTEGEAEELLEHLDDLGYKWLSGRSLLDTTFREDYRESTCYIVGEDMSITFGRIENHENGIEFSDLIIPDISAEEAWSIAREISNMSKDIMKEIFYDFDYCRYDFWNQYTPEEAKSRIEQWKSEHEKKEPEVEWFWRSYVVGGSDFKEADTEQEAMEWCENYVKEHPEAKCTYKHVCRVKAVN